MLHNVFVAKVKPLKKPQLGLVRGKLTASCPTGQFRKHAAGMRQAWMLNALTAGLSPRSKNLLKVQTFKMVTDKKKKILFGMFSKKKIRLDEPRAL